MKRTLSAAACALIGTILAPAGSLDAAPPKPEIMLLIGSSRSMQRAVGVCNADGCVAEDAVCYSGAIDWATTFRTVQSDQYKPARIHMIKEALTGSRQGNFACAADPECIFDQQTGMCSPDVFGGEDNDADAAHANYRQVCCDGVDANGGCTSAAFCGRDSGDMVVNGDAVVSYPDMTGILPYTPGTNRGVGADGVIYTVGAEVKFGLMTLDGDVDRQELWKGGFSYPNETYWDNGQRVDVQRLGSELVESGAVPDVLAGALARLRPPVGQALTTGTFDRLPTQAADRLNLGIRNIFAPYGGLIDSDRGTGQPVNDRNVQVGDLNDSNVLDHNRLVVGPAIRAIVPSGAAPIAAALHDATDYFKRSIADNSNPANACRDRSLVYIGDEPSARYVGGFKDNSVSPGVPCVANGDCNAIPGGRCELPNNADPNSRASKAGHALCVYPEGYPYRPSVEYASELYQSGIPVYVVGFAPSKEAQVEFKAIADAGSPGRGPQGGGGYYRADTIAELRTALEKIRNSQVAGTRSHTRPLVLFPRKGDTNAPATVRQWRFNAWSEVPGGGDAFAYGKLERADLSCPVGGQPGADTAARVVAGTTEFQSVLNASRNAPRRVVAREGANLFVASGGNGASMFNGDGTVGAAYTDAQVRTFTNTTRPGGAGNAAADEALRFVGRQMNGYFGLRGLPDGPMNNVGARVLGALVNTDMVAITPPALPLTLGAYVNFAMAHRDRPTMVAAGAADGLLHIFRADTGAEVINIVPFSAWPNLKASSTVSTLDGPLDVADVAGCRKYGVQAPVNCPAGLTEPSLRTMLVGGVGKGGANIFGVDITNTTALAKAVVTDPVNLLTLFTGGVANSPRIWDITRSSPVPFAAKLGNAVSRPTLTHVRAGDAIRAAVIVGCGADPSTPLTANLAGVGRCILVLDAVTGETIRVLDNADLEVSGEGNLDMPVTGSAAVWPRNGIAPADRAYIGDTIGRLWRLDLRDRDPARWRIRRISPLPAPGNELDYRTGREVIGRPAVLAQESGKLTVIYSTGSAAALQGNPAAPAAYAVSLSDGLVTNNQGVRVFGATTNWVYQMGVDEVGTGEVAVVGNIALFTTSQTAAANSCAGDLGRLYGVHIFDRYRDANNAAATFAAAPPAPGMAADNRRIMVKPMLPNLANPNPGHEILAVRLPQGRVAYGVTVAEVPSCTDGEGTATEVVMNLSNNESGRRAAPSPADMWMESVENGQLSKLRYDNNMFAKAAKTELSLCLNCGTNGKATGGRQHKAPFAASVSYWGSTFTE